MIPAAMKKIKEKRVEKKTAKTKVEQLSELLDTVVFAICQSTENSRPDVYESIAIHQKDPAESTLLTMVRILLAALSHDTSYGGLHTSQNTEMTLYRNPRDMGQENNASAENEYYTYDQSRMRDTSHEDTQGRDYRLENLQRHVGNLEVEKRAMFEAHERDRNAWRENTDRKERNLRQELENGYHLAQRQQQDLHRDAEQKLNDEIRQLQGEKAGLLSKFQADWREMTRTHKDEVARLIKSHESITSSLRQGFDIKIQQSAEKLQENENTLKIQHAKELKSLQSDFAEEKGNLKRNIEKLKAEYDATIAAMEQEHEAQYQECAQQAAESEQKLREQHSAALKSLKASQVEQTRKLKKDNDALSETLLQRDKYHAMSDKDLKAKFLSLSEDVENLARGKWKLNHPKWTPGVLQSMLSNQRLLGKYIVHDTIWIILNENVFQSPFRVMGEEGQKLEQQWLADCGNQKETQIGTEEFQWPAPGVETERWRYSTVKECQAALMQPASEWDARARLKERFKNAMEKLQGDLITALDELIVVDEQTNHAVEKITKKAANMWLAFGTQRCRILLAFKGSNLKTAEDKIREAQEGSLKLTVEPTLMRFGNSKGQDLDSSEVIGGCEGKIIELKWSDQGARSQRTDH
ncbi:hypothetical protein VTL71DRAFT_10893 [Oculimacula yallundae]|uniref:Uncharacterized protein n=1 Tax=Oculimacula yallundae TaxID=86028 RepID=A0ABR4CUR1_9HELO